MGRFFYGTPATLFGYNSAMALYKDKRTGIWYVSYMDIAGCRVRKSLETKNRNVAAIKEGEFLTRRKSADTIRVPLEAFLVRYRAYLAATRKPDTARHFEIGLKKLLTFKPGIEFLDEITPAVLDDCAITLKSKIKGPNAPGLNRAIRAVKTAMRQAEFWDMIPPQNWRKVSKFKESKGRVEYHTPEEIAQILKIFNPEWKLVVLLGCRAGLRRGEIAALTWDDIDFKHNQLYVAPNKTDKYRYIPLAKDLRKALEKAFEKHKSTYVVDVGKNRDSKYFLTKYYENETSALPFRCHLHKLRHTFASHLVQAGVDLYRVKNLMGHSSIQMTEIYAHLAPSDLTSAIEKLPTIK